MEITGFIKTLPADRQDIISKFHQVIIDKDPNIVVVLKPMMGKEMILYEQRGYMKYALASAAKYISLHCLPMYMDNALYQKFEALLPKAKFQKGCINFNNEQEMPADGLAQVIATCSAVDIADVMEKRKKK